MQEIISIHALREEGDKPRSRHKQFLQHFYPRPPRGGRQAKEQAQAVPTAFLSTPSARRATISHTVSGCRTSRISIHALREEDDGDMYHTMQSVCYFYPRPLRGGRQACIFTRTITSLFLSTPSARRTTKIVEELTSGFKISIHALREEGDPDYRLQDNDYSKFLSTPSARRATAVTGLLPGKSWNFYPRPPRGGRQQKQRENTLLLSHYTPPCTNCKEVSVKQAVELHRYLHSRPLFQCEASRKTMYTVCSHWPDIKRSARCSVQTPGVVQRVRPWSGSCCPVGRTADCLRRGRSGQWNLSQCTPSGRVLDTVTV